MGAVAAPAPAPARQRVSCRACPVCRRCSPHCSPSPRAPRPRALGGAAQPRAGPLTPVRAPAGADVGRDSAGRGPQEGKLGPEAAHSQKAREARATHAASDRGDDQEEGSAGRGRGGAGAPAGRGRGWHRQGIVPGVLAATGCNNAWSCAPSAGRQPLDPSRAAAVRACTANASPERHGTSPHPDVRCSFPPIVLLVLDCAVRATARGGRAERRWLSSATWRARHAAPPP